MRIKQLEIQGFKSFVDRTVIPFDHDVVGVVGPNGCGKSNIVDAIRWCLGEQSARHLRGKAMTDVIFNGSDTRGPQGLAEVTLTFDNTDPARGQGLPIEYREYPEIAVTRRLFRDGTSEYLVNKTQVRLKDITDLFLGTGVGTKAYSIVEQGKIGMIVSAKAEERRLLIEEAAGITKYKHRRKQAEQKMDLTRQNLARVSDIIQEIERNLASLKRQADKAERYKAYREELQDLLLHEASCRFLELTVVARVESETLATVRDGAEASHIARTTREAELEACRLAAFQLEERAEKAQNAAFAATQEARSKEAQIARAKDQLATLTTRMSQAERERSDLLEQEHTLETERITLAEKLHALEHEQLHEERVGLEAQELLEAVRSEELTANRTLGDLRTQASQAASRVAASQAKLDGYERRVSEMHARRERLVLEAETLRSTQEELGDKRQELADQVGELEIAKRDRSTKKTQLEVELKATREQLVVVERELETAKNELSQKKNRLRALEEIHRRLEGVGAGTKHLLTTRHASLAGLVAERIEAPREFTQALAGLLGDHLQDIVVHDLAEGVGLLTELARKKKGRAALITQRPPQGEEAIADPSPLQGTGVLGPLLDKLHYAAEDAPLVHALVDGAVVIDTLEHAWELAPHASGRTLVCLDGSVVERKGRMVGGSSDTVAAGMLDQHREIRELTEQIRTLDTDVSERVETQQALRTQASERSAQLEQVQRETHQIELDYVSMEKDLRRAEDQTTSVLQRVSAIESDTGEVDDQLAEAADEASDAQAVLEEGQNSLREAERAAIDAETMLAERRERVAAQQALMTEYKVRLAQLRTQTTGVRTTTERISRSVEELQTRHRRLDEELTTGAQRFGVTAAQLMANRERLDETIALARAAESELTEAKRLFESARQDLGARETELKDLRTRASSLAEERTRREMQLERLTLEKEHLLAGVREKFRGLDLRRVIGDYHARPLVGDTHRARIQELIALIERMGPVNLDAVREHQEAFARHTFYVTQRADLEGALSDLEQAILQMNRESIKLFRDTFESINQKFQILFPRMFRGGTARLVLTQPEDLLETGIEILAQPPGKKLGNIELMSGGEKALTAVSLIFAMFEHKPSPFCVLDEVDAPLDEANVTRYNEAIRSMTDQSQFILITHIHRTMQSVDVLYGITMQEPGVSKLVAVKVNDAPSRRSPPESASAVA